MLHAISIPARIFLTYQPSIVKNLIMELKLCSNIETVETEESNVKPRL